VPGIGLVQRRGVETGVCERLVSYKVQPAAPK